MNKIYKSITSVSEPLLNLLLKKRLRKGKEDSARINERRGQTSTPRPEGKIIWIHAASVGEAQSALILIDAVLKKHKQAHILITSGTRTSAQMLDKKLPSQCIHQYYPLDHPKWVARFLEHWQPDTVLWMESELWPNMLNAIAKRNIPAALVNARLSPRSFKRWTKFKKSIVRILSAFQIIICQTDQEQQYFKHLGASNVVVSDNIKYSADALPHDKNTHAALTKAMRDRPVWVYASTHKGEEKLACEVHVHLKETIPDLLTIIVPRHPDRGRQIVPICEKYGLDSVRRGQVKRLPDSDTGIYIADTLGELGLFYTLCPIAVIGRSFSDDGGGGHNPIEAAQLNCAVMHGPNVQNLQDIFDDMNAVGAAIKINDKEAFSTELLKLLNNKSHLNIQQRKAMDFAQAKTRVIDTVMDYLKPLLKDI